MRKQACPGDDGPLGSKVIVRQFTQRVALRQESMVVLVPVSLYSQTSI